MKNKCYRFVMISILMINCNKQLSLLIGLVIYSCGTDKKQTIELSNCEPFVILQSIDVWVEETGWSVEKVVQDVSITVWEFGTDSRGKKMGEIQVGSHALLLDEKSDYYKVRSLFDNSIGWINKIQATGIRKMNPKTFEYCD